MFLEYYKANMALTDKIEYFVRKPEKGIHSEAHALAKEISEFCGEPKKFGMYLGVIKNMGLSRAYQVFAELKQGKEIKTPGKLFLYLSANKKAPAVKPKPKSKNGNCKRTGKNTPEKISAKGGSASGRKSYKHANSQRVQ